MCPIDHFIAACLPALAVWILISGLDDLFLDLVCFTDWVCRRLRGERRIAPPIESPGDTPASVRKPNTLHSGVSSDSLTAPEKQIAIFIPLWHEDRVIGPMLEHNLAAIGYENYAVFAGAYPND